MENTIRNFVKQTKLTQAIVDLLARKFVQCDGIYASKCAIEDLCGVALILFAFLSSIRPHFTFLLYATLLDRAY